jgi:hypothetical protein
MRWALGARHQWPRYRQGGPRLGSLRLNRAVAQLSTELAADFGLNREAVADILGWRCPGLGQNTQWHDRIINRRELLVTHIGTSACGHRGRALWRKKPR